jgi:hypothetical protein
LGAPCLHEPRRPRVRNDPGIAPAEGRALAPHLRFVVEGTLAASSPDRAIACGDTITPATLERHSERMIHEGVVAARSDRFAVEDDSGGHVLAEWTTPTE